MTAATARRWLVWVALALGIGAGVVGTPTRRGPVAPPPVHATALRGC